MFVQHKVNDYAEWRKVYDSVGEMQKAGGVTEAAVYRSVEDPNSILVMHRFNSADQAQAFTQNPDLREAMGKGGVIESSLRIEVYEEA